MTLTGTARTTAWLLLAAAFFLTLVPRRFRPFTGVEHHLEHLLAFALLGLMFGLGYPERRRSLAAIGVIVLGGLELLQLWVPGRHALFGDFVVNAVGLCCGLAAAAALEWIMAMRKR